MAQEEYVTTSPHTELTNRTACDNTLCDDIQDLPPCDVTESTDSVCYTQSNASSFSFLNGDVFNNQIRTVVKDSLDPIADARKVKLISNKGKSVKFPVKLMFVLETCTEFQNAISWSFDGLSFIIHDPDQLEKEVLPNTFKDAKFNSFLRKLYRWGFAKRTLEGRQCAYINEKFQRGNYSLCMDMSCTNPSVANSKRLRQEIENVEQAASNAQHYSNLQQATMEQLAFQQQQMYYQMSNNNIIPDQALYNSSITTNQYPSNSSGYRSLPVVSGAHNHGQGLLGQMSTHSQYMNAANPQYVPYQQTYQQGLNASEIVQNINPQSVFNQHHINLQPNDNYADAQMTTDQTEYNQQFYNGHIFSRGGNY